MPIAESDVSVLSDLKRQGKQMLTFFLHIRVKLGLGKLMFFFFLFNFSHESIDHILIFLYIIEFEGPC